MTTENIHFEGKDSVGKGDAAKNAVAAILFSKEVTYHGKVYPPEDICVIQTDYPQYWGLGALIRKMNSKIGRDYFKEKGYTQTEILHLRKAIYSIDRLLALLVLDNIKKDPKKLYIHISDRGPYSHAVTHAVCFTDEAEYIASLEDIIDADHCYVNRIQPNSVLLEAEQSGLGGAGGREALDDLEKPLYQKLADKGFDVLKRDPRSKMNSVVTRVGKEWRDRDQIAAEVLGSVGIECQGMPDFASLTPKDFSRAIRQGRLISIGAAMFISYLYPNLTIDNYPELGTIYSFDTRRRVQIYSNGDDFLGTITGESIKDKKEAILRDEQINSSKIGYLLQDQEMFNRLLPKDIAEYGRYLLTDYTGGELLALVHHLDAFWQVGHRHGTGETGYERMLRQLFIPDVRYW